MRVRAYVALLSLAAACAASAAPPGGAVSVTAPSAGDTELFDQSMGWTSPLLEVVDTRARVHPYPAPRLRTVRRVARHRPAPHGPCPAYGTVLVPGSAWLAGQGVDVISNGGNGADCFSLEAGHHRQCGELVNRLLAARRWSPAIAGDAANFYDNADPTFFDKHLAGSGYLPVPGDIVVWSGGVPAPGAPQGYGHVAVVAADSGGVLTVVEQNSTISGYGRIPIDSTGAIGPIAGLAVVGFLHARANPLAPAPVPTQTTQPKPAPKPPTHHPHHPGHPGVTTPSPPAPPAPSQPTGAPTATSSATVTPVTPTAAPTLVSSPAEPASTTPAAATSTSTPGP